MAWRRPEGVGVVWFGVCVGRGCGVDGVGGGGGGSRGAYLADGLKAVFLETTYIQFCLWNFCL